MVSFFVSEHHNFGLSTSLAYQSWEGYLGVAVQADLVAGVSGFGELFGEGYENVGWGEEGGLRWSFCRKSLEGDRCRNRGAEDVAGDVGGGLERAVPGIDPVRHGVDVDCVCLIRMQSLENKGL